MCTVSYIFLKSSGFDRVEKIVKPAIKNPKIVVPNPNPRSQRERINSNLYEKFLGKKLVSRIKIKKIIIVAKTLNLEGGSFRMHWR